MLYIYQKELEAWQNKFIPPLANEIYKFFVDIFNNALTTVRKEKNLKIDSAEETRETFIEFIHKLIKNLHHFTSIASSDNIFLLKHTVFRENF